MIANVAVLVAVFFALMSGHWFPWHIFSALVTSEKKLKPVAAYVYGVTCILIGFLALAAINQFPAESVIALVIVCVVAGLGTIAPRLVWLVLDKTADE